MTIDYEKDVLRSIIYSCYSLQLVCTTKSSESLTHVDGASEANSTSSVPPLTYANSPDGSKVRHRRVGLVFRVCASDHPNVAGVGGHGSVDAASAFGPNLAKQDQFARASL